MLTPYPMIKNMFDELAESAFSANIMRGMMNTDIKESVQGYELDIDLPGVHKENLAAELKTVTSASAPRWSRRATTAFRMSGICAGNASSAPAAAASM